MLVIVVLFVVFANRNLAVDLSLVISSKFTEKMSGGDKTESSICTLDCYRLD